MLEETSRSLKIVLLVLFVTLLAVVVLVILTQKGLIGNKTTTEPVVQSPARTMPVPPTGTQQQAGNGSQAVSPSSYIPMEEAQKQFKAIQDQVNAGTLSKEEAQKQMQAVGSQIAPPPLPPEIQAQIDARKAQR